MRTILLINAFFSSLFSFGQKGILEGHWRRTDAAIQKPDTSELHGDLLLGGDSTFILVGNGHSFFSDIPGWNTDETIIGKWTIYNNILSLYIEGTAIPLAYKIRRISKKNLLISPKLSKDVKLKYKRIRSFG
jgi:hypothetical protein